MALDRNLEIHYFIEDRAQANIKLHKNHKYYVHLLGRLKTGKHISVKPFRRSDHKVVLVRGFQL